MIVFKCKYCDKEFQSYEACDEHEETHMESYEDADNATIADMLKELSDKAWGYHIDEMVLGMPIRNFKSLMTEAAERLKNSSE